MTNPTAHWHAEHANFTRLLDLLERQVMAFHKAERPDYDLMLDICKYLQHYPGRHHHPREDIAFACLMKRDPMFKQQIARLMLEHRAIATAGEQLIGMLEDCIAGGLVERAAVEACADTYLVYYRQHIEEEEIEIVPAAARLLTPDDWAAVAAAVPASHDPLFGDAQEERYRELRRQIAIEARSEPQG
jgi:hemerythrin-like domain-containing protein